MYIEILSAPQLFIDFVTSLERSGGSLSQDRKYIYTYLERTHYNEATPDMCGPSSHIAMPNTKEKWDALHEKVCKFYMHG